MFADSPKQYFQDQNKNMTAEAKCQLEQPDQISKLQVVEEKKRR